MRRFLFGFVFSMALFMAGTASALIMTSGEVPVIDHEPWNGRNLQYFGELLDTPPQGDRRVVYFDGEDLGQAFDRLGTTMLDAEASHAIFDDHNRLHRDVLADATTGYLMKLSGTA